MSTISEVARRAGVSSATVSRVVSNRGYVSAETRAKVLKAVEELDFVPNAMARGLKTKQSRLIALLVPEIVNSFYTTIARGVEDVANEHGFQVILGNTDESTVKEKTYVELMVANHIDGIILAPAGRSGRHLKALQAREVPAIVVDRSVEGFKADFVRGDSVNGALQLTQHLLGLNHRQIVFINGHPETSSARDREVGFRAALTNAGIAVDERWISHGTWFIDDAEARTDRVLTEAPGFTAIFAANNFMAIGALRALRRHGRRVPEDMALVCFDDVEVAAEIDPFLTVMAQPAYTMGTLAAQLLLERINGRFTGPAREVVLTPRLLVRRSCGAMSGTGNAEADDGHIGATPEAAARA
ncbi:MAG: LacI family transcriptional regulator [Thermomicrobiales bacterium]|nr:LacI family transcriptional regulator [Thermomicrobiales bacterium]